MTAKIAPILLFEDTVKQEAFYFSDPVEEICVHDSALVAQAFEKIEQLRRKGLYMAGYVSYEAGYSFFPAQEINLKKADLPLLHFYAFSKKNIGLPEAWQNLKPPSSAPLTGFSLDTSPELYAQLQSEIREHLYSGDIYQQNQTVQMTFTCKQEAMELYLSLRDMQKTQYTAFLNFQEYQILSFSPELFYKKSGDRIFVEPMKGTLSVSEKAETLQKDEKNISENLMIVDLLRNDLGRIAQPGSVVVEELFKVQTLETVHQMTSKISAKVDQETSILALFQSLFPCGSITGAPKWSAMKYISQQEVSPRGAYTGAIGYVEPNNDHCFNVAIRTLTARNNQYTLGVGGGIVADSEVQSEYQEALLKSRFVRKLNSSFYLFETLLFDGLVCRDLSLHLQRLQTAAGELGFEYNEALIESKLSAKLCELAGEFKIKIKLMYDGEVEIDVAELGSGNMLGEGLIDALDYEKGINDFKEEIPKISLSPHKINSLNIFQKHKTSNRKMYDEEFARVQQQGLYDVVFLNENSELTEASRHNIFVKTNGAWKTPPIASGALPGIARGRALEELQAKEIILKLEDLRQAEEIILTNSVRGFVRVSWSES